MPHTKTLVEVPVDVTSVYRVLGGAGWGGGVDEGPSLWPERNACLVCTSLAMQKRTQMGTKSCRLVTVCGYQVVTTGAVWVQRKAPIGGRMSPRSIYELALLICKAVGRSGDTAGMYANGNPRNEYVCTLGKYPCCIYIYIQGKSYSYGAMQIRVLLPEITVASTEIVLVHEVLAEIQLPPVGKCVYSSRQGKTLVERGVGHSASEEGKRTSTGIVYIVHELFR